MRKRNTSIRKKRQYAVAAAVVLTAAVCSVWKLQTGQSDGGDAQETSLQSADVIWQGQGYNYNDHLSNYLFLGIDRDEMADTQSGLADAGQADALFLLSLDRVEGTLCLITIPRDTMTQIESYGPGGNSLGESRDHISLSYAYGDGKHESCRLTKKAVSDLFYGLPIQGYCAMAMEGLPVLMEAAGGVTVTVPDDSLETVDARFSEGAKITLHAEDIEMFVRYRDVEISQSALSRTRRQQAFLQGLGTAVSVPAAGDSTFASEFLTGLEPYLMTSMGSADFLRILECVENETEKRAWTVPGEGVAGEEYDEYRVDEEDLYEKIIETFYETAEGK